MNWYTVKVKYTKTLEDGKIKRVTEPYLLNAASFTDAEARAHEEVGATVRGEFDVVSISRTDVHDIFSDDDADTWYKCKVTYEDVVDDKPKKISNNYLASGESVKTADAKVKEGLSSLMLDFKVDSVILTPIVDIFPMAIAGQVVEDKLAI